MAAVSLGNPFAVVDRIFFLHFSYTFVYLLQISSYVEVSLTHIVTYKLVLILVFGGVFVFVWCSW